MDGPYRLVFFITDDPSEGQFHPVERYMVPEWITHPDTLTRLLEGECVQDTVEGDDIWFGAMKI